MSRRCREYHEIASRLRRRGFREDQRTGAPVCRWRLGDLAVDVVPSTDSILGFSNRWYPLGVKSARSAELPGGRVIRTVTAPVFVATKLEAFRGRGNGDFLFSHDLEDMVSVVDGRSTLLDECLEAPPALQAYLAAEILGLLGTPAFIDALPGYLPGDAMSQQRLPDVTQTLRRIAALVRP
jgi:hypothetical protein